MSLSPYPLVSFVLGVSSTTPYSCLQSTRTRGYWRSFMSCAPPRTCALRHGLVELAQSFVQAVQHPNHQTMLDRSSFCSSPPAATVLLAPGELGASTGWDRSTLGSRRLSPRGHDRVVPAGTARARRRSGAHRLAQRRIPMAQTGRWSLAPRTSSTVPAAALSGLLSPLRRM